MAYECVVCGVLCSPAPNHDFKSVGFTVQMSEGDITGFEGDILRPEVQLEGQLVGEVDVQLQLLTVSEFLSTSVAPPGFTVSDAVECMCRHA